MDGTRSVDILIFTWSIKAFNPGTEVDSSQNRSYILMLSLFVEYIRIPGMILIKQ
jgi:hypothetical protein